MKGHRIVRKLIGFACLLALCALKAWLMVFILPLLTDQGASKTYFAK
jgi:hypothetical protein